ncbi:hypothetical protein A4A49_07936, partial [Nicotiana attenuata]
CSNKKRYTIFNMSIFKFSFVTILLMGATFNVLWFSNKQVMAANGVDYDNSELKRRLLPQLSTCWRYCTSDDDCSDCWTCCKCSGIYNGDVILAVRACWWS